MENREAIEWLEGCVTSYEVDNKGRLNGYVTCDLKQEVIDMAISALEKQDAIQSCTPPSDDWEHYADRLHDIAYKSGYEQGKRDAEEDEA